MSKPTTDPLAGCKVETELIERRKIVGPMARSNEVMQHLYEQGWRVTFSGSYTDRKMFPRCDGGRFLFHAERTIEPGTSGGE